MVGYPVLPLLFIAASIFVVGSTIASMEPLNAGIGIGLLSAGVVVYFGFRWARPAEAPSS
jgi:uncharacterized membrane protein